MNAAVFSLALVMFIVGGASIAGGLPIVGEAIGGIRVMAGTIVMTGGCIVFALGCVAAAFGRSRASLPANAPAAAPVPLPPLPPAAAERAEIREPVDAFAASRPAETVSHAPDPVPERRLAATYSAGGIGYFMYSDGSIEAEMEIGRYRFPNMDALRDFIETGDGGVRVGPPGP